jgi:hypothetical protein
MTIRFIGANPGITVLDGDQRVAFASVWRADWSEHGTGRAIVLWDNGVTRVATSNSVLGDWLTNEFTRHFPEVAGLSWPEPEVIVTDIELSLDLDRGMQASGGGITVQIGPPTGRRMITVDPFNLNGVRHRLSLVFMPSLSGSITVDDERIRGSSVKAFLADAEVWSIAG